MRLFIGLGIPEHLRMSLAALQGGIPGARWVKPENYHITLRFLGELSRHQARDIDAALSDLDVPEFEVALSGVGCFGSKGRVRDVWTGVVPEGALNHLQSKVERACVQEAMPPDRRKFKPHCTLARMRDVPEHACADFMNAHAAFSTMPFDVERFYLYESHLGREGAHYEVVAEYPLRAFVY